MVGLSVAVTLPGTSRTTYLFDKIPVTVGRDDDCDLTIPHQAVPRRLLAAWIEADGEHVRIEERPELTNPLLSGKTRVDGGISGTDITLSVGPVLLRFCPETRMNEKPKKKKTVLLAALSVLLVALVAFASRSRRRGQGVDHLIASLPKSPLCDPPLERCNTHATCAERARLRLSRGEEILSHPNSSHEEKIKGAAMLAEAAALMGQLGTAEQARAAAAAHHASLLVTRTYQQDVMRLKSALEGRNSKKIITAAKTVSVALSACHPSEKSKLDTLIAVHQRSLEASL
jgi:hypothetical protein